MRAISKNSDFPSMAFETLSLEQQGTVLLLYLNRPYKLNAINTQMLQELEQVFSNSELLAGVRSILITGHGKAFAAGADIAELAECTASTGEQFARRGQRIFQKIESSPIPVIAAVNGYALGGGCELAMACHFRFASKNAVFGQPEIKLGIIPGYGGTQRLTRLAGQTRAIELLITGDHISAERAYEIGLVNRVVEPDHLLDETLAFCTKIGQLPPLAIAELLRCVYKTQQEDFDLEAQRFGYLCGTEDFREGTQAFLEKRQPHFRGR